MKRLISVLVFAICMIGGVYYAATNNEAQGTVVVLLGILYFVALPRL